MQGRTTTCLALFLLLILSTTAFATHNRAGEICYEHTSGNSFNFTVTTYTDPDSPADRDSLTVVFDADDPVGTSVTIPRKFEEILIAGQIKKNTYCFEYTYPGPGCYVVYMEDPNRVEGICNMDGSVNVPFFLQDTICIYNPITVGYNNSVQLTVPPIQNAIAGTPWIHNPGPEDPDGDSLRFSLIVPLQAPSLDVPGYQYPHDYDRATVGCDADLTIDPLTGVVTWDAPCQCCIYNIAILVREFRDGRFLGSKIRDMQVFVECGGGNEPPEIAEVKDTCIIAGGPELEIFVTATDPDNDDLDLLANGGPFIVDTSPATFTPILGEPPPVGQFFRWQTVCDHVRENPYQVVFQARDNGSIAGSPFPLTDLESWLITVVAPEPTGLTATAIGNRVELAWDSLYACYGSKNFRGFSVWRRTGCDSLIEFDVCQRGLGGTAYTKIADLETAHSYTDFDVVRGPVYSYRIVAEFAESPPGSPFTFNHVGSRPSDAVCVELRRDLPVMTNASVEVTDATNGEVFVAWVAPDPDDLDTLLNRPPYRYELWRSEGLTPGPGLTNVVNFTSATFAGYDDTSFQDVGRNTLDLQFVYTVRFYATDDAGDEVFVGETTPASTPRLSIGSLDNALNLTWSENVSWDNYEYDVYREIPGGSGTFLRIATVPSMNYLDDSLSNGREYCYYVEAHGTFGSASLPDSLINLSQIACAVPMDTTPSCAPTLTVDNICNEASTIPFDPIDLRNDLAWNNPNLFCADDVVSYNVYFAPTASQPFELLIAIGDPEDTLWSHDGLQSLAGCYAVTAIDSFGNESALSNIVCVDNCPLYELPNVFTPNNDGANDLFTPILPFRFIDRIDMQIFDKRGGLVYETTDPAINWDGNYKGKPLAEGVYYYVCDVVELRVEGAVPREAPLSGYIHLIRGNGGRNP